jgi:glycosyltransferase involved in cell wall biosynthesis
VRILLDYRPALRERTGVGEYVHELARALVGTAPASEALTLFSSSWKDRLDPNVIPGATVVDRRVPVQWLDFAWHRLEWPPAERLAGQAFDVAHSTRPLLMPATSAARVVTIYDLDFLDHPERTRREIRRDYAALVPSHAVRADHVVVISRHTAREVERRLQVPQSRISVCYPGAPKWLPRDSEPLNGCILFLGTLEPRKNLGVLLDAYEALLGRQPRSVPLVLAGRIPPDAAALVERTSRPPLAGHVELPGYVSDDKRVDLYRRALVFVLASHEEGFGIPAVEAMAIGVPVIAADRGALPEAVGDAGLLVDSSDARALAAALEAVLGSADRRAQMREAGLRQARGFQWRDTAAGVRLAWAAALARRKAGHG